jgi:threonine/homoserine/homoserine lactone efflux protein
MLIVGGSAARIAIVVYLAWIGVKSLRAAWRARAEKREAPRQAARRHAAHAAIHAAPRE